jgi:hypothetical protein
MRQSSKWIGLALLVASPAFAAEVYEVNMDGPQAGTGSAFVGSGTVTLNGAGTQFTVSLTHNIPNANVTDGHIHQNPIGVQGGTIVFPFTQPGAGDSPINEVFAITPAQLAVLRAGNYYVNIHTMAFSGGEIRGQILPKPDTDQDLLYDDVETDTGIFISPNDTGSDPNDSDSDDDGVIDGTEVELGFNPNSALSVPPGLPVGRVAVLLAVVAVLIASAGFALYRRTSRSE